MNRLNKLALALALGLALNACANGGTEERQQSRALNLAAPHVVDEVLIQFAAGSSPAARAAARAAAGATPLETIRSGADGVLERARLAPGHAIADAVRDLSSDAAVVFAEPNYIYQHTAVTDPYYVDGRLWGIHQADATEPPDLGTDYDVDATEAWATTTGSPNVYVGVIDEGIQYAHPDLAANVWTNPFDPVDGVDNDGNGYIDDEHGWDFANNDASVYDGGTRGLLDSHGTHVSGTIGATANGAGVVGVNHSVRLISSKFLGRNGGTLADAVKAVDYLTELKTGHGLPIVASNNSWGGGGYSQALFDAINRANDANILFIAAASNDGRNNDTTPSYPSSYNLPNVIAVAAITSTGALASYSNYGATQVDLGAPGSEIYSTIPYNSYGAKSGTSMATPHVTGVAALVAAANPSLSAAQIKGILLANVDARASLAGKTVTGGTVNARKAVKAALPCQPTDEVCDGADNDCDTVVDENPSGVGASCGLGACAGTTACTGGELVCDGPLPSAEVCDGLDNNCDGVVDNGGNELCDGVDNDCDAVVDETPVDAGGACGVGACAGATTCTNGGLACSGPAPSDEVCEDSVDNDCDGVVDNGCPVICTPSEEVCDGVDNNCDGTIDDSPTGVGGSCGVGACAGTTICTGGGLTCNGPAPSAEVCGDSLDNDCDGTVDDGCAPVCTLAPPGASCTASSQCCSNKCTGKPGKMTCK